MIDFKLKRKDLTESLRKKGIEDTKALYAISNVPREMFVINDYIDSAYDDKALPLICNQTISQPYTVAYMTELLEISSGDKILEIGTGSGYQAAILYKSGAEVYSVERIPDLYERSKEIFEKLDYTILQKLDDGNLGWLEYAPYDSIIVTAALREFPVKLMKQLKNNGRIIFPIGDEELQTMNVVTKIDENKYKQDKKAQFRFVPMIGAYGWDEQ